MCTSDDSALRRSSIKLLRKVSFAGLMRKDAAVSSPDAAATETQEAIEHQHVQAPKQVIASQNISLPNFIPETVVSNCKYVESPKYCPPSPESTTVSTASLSVVSDLSDEIQDSGDFDSQGAKQHELEDASRPKEDSNEREGNGSLFDKRRALRSLGLDIRRRLHRLESFSSGPQEEPKHLSPVKRRLLGLSGQESAAQFHQSPLDSDSPFLSQFKPEEMRCLALVAQSHMIPAMKDFVQSHRELLKKFRLTGTSSTIAVLKSVYGHDPDIRYGPICATSGSLSGKAQLAAQLCLQDVGGVIFFMDPVSVNSASQADVEAIMCMANLHNLLIMPNPASAMAMSHMLRQALVEGKREMIPSFFVTLQSPSVKEHKKKEERGLQCNDFFGTMLDAALLLRIYCRK